MSYTIEELKDAVVASRSYCEVLRRLNKTISGAGSKHIREKIKKNNIDTSHFSTVSNYRNNSRKKWQEILIFNPNLKSREQGSLLRKNLILYGREYKCEICNINQWLGKNLILEVDHIDGNWRNNCPNNLRFLCHNCHSLTDNFYKTKTIYFCSCGKTRHKNSSTCFNCWKLIIKDSKHPNSMKSKIPTKQILEKLVWQKSMSSICKDFMVSDVTIKKWCKKYDIQTPPMGYWSRNR